MVTIAVPGNSGSSYYSLATNQSVTFNSGYNQNATLGVNFGDGSYAIYNPSTLSAAAQPIQFTGATNVVLSEGNYGPAFVTFTICSPQTNAVSYVPANAVVIPSDATGPVQIILESSSDLVNWVPALPGTYGSTYTNRFFRVRAVAQ